VRVCDSIYCFCTQPINVHVRQPQARVTQLHAHGAKLHTQAPDCRCTPANCACTPSNWHVYAATAPAAVQCMRMLPKLQAHAWPLHVHVGQKHKQKWLSRDLRQNATYLAWRLGIGLNRLPEPPKVPGGSFAVSARSCSTSFNESERQRRAM